MMDRMEHESNYIAANCKVTGTLEVTGKLIIDGQAEGKIICKGDLVISRSGRVEAEIEAENVSVQGELHGNIMAANLLEISATGVVHGAIRSNQLRIERGARFYGISTDSLGEEPLPDLKATKFELAFQPAMIETIARQIEMHSVKN